MVIANTPWMMLCIALVAAAATVAMAHPASLECGTDSTTRLALGAQVMGGAVTEGDPEKDGVKAIFDKTSGQVAVAARSGTYFAVRLMGGGALAPLAQEVGLNQTADCKSQAYVAVDHAAGGVYNFTATGYSSDGYIAVGYSADGPPGIKLITSK